MAPKENSYKANILPAQIIAAFIRVHSRDSRALS